MAENIVDKQKKPNKSYALESLMVMSVAFELGFIIALPITGLALLGKWLDQKYGVSYYLYIGIVLAMIVSGLTVYGRLSSLIARLNKAANSRNQTSKENTK